MLSADLSLLTNEYRAMSHPAKFKALYKLAALCWSSVILVACNNSTPPRPAVAQISPESFTQFGDYQLHYNALSTHDLSSEVAQQYGIQHSAQRGLVIISVLYKDAKTPGFQPVAAELSVTTHNLIDQATHIPMRRVDEGNAISYIGEVDVKHRQVLIFEIKAIPSTTSQVLAAKFQHEFFVD